MGSSPNFKFSQCINLVLIFFLFLLTFLFFFHHYTRYGQVKSKALEENQQKKEIQTKYQGWFKCGVCWYNILPVLDLAILIYCHVRNRET